MARYRNKQTGEIIEIGESRQQEEYSATEGMSPLDAGLVSAGRTFYQIGDTLGLLDLNREEDARYAEQLQREFPVATAVGAAAPSLALPGGLAAQVGYSAALPVLQEGAAGLPGGAAGAGITAALGVGSRGLGRVVNALRGRYGKELASGVIASDIPGGRIGAGIERQASARALGAGPRQSINDANQDLINRTTAEWVGQSGSKVDLGQVYDDASRLFKEAAQSAGPVRVGGELVEGVSELGSSTAKRLAKPVMAAEEAATLRNELAAIQRGSRDYITRQNASEALRGLDDAMVQAGFDEDTLKAARLLWGKARTLDRGLGVIDDAGNVSAAKLRNAMKQSPLTKTRARRNKLGQEEKRLFQQAKDIVGQAAEQRTSMTSERLPLDLIAPLGLGISLGPLAGIATLAAPGIASRGLLGRSLEILDPRLAGAVGRSAGQGSQQ